MSKQQFDGARDEAVVEAVVEAVDDEPSPTTLADWLAKDRVATAAEALQLIGRVGGMLMEAHRRGVSHGQLSTSHVVLSPEEGEGLGAPTLIAFGTSRASALRREDVAADVAGLGQIAEGLLAPPQVRRNGQPGPIEWKRRKAMGAVIEAARDRHEGVFLFESPLDFVAALEVAFATDEGAASKPDPALVALRRRRRRRRVIKVVAGAALACVAMLVAANPPTLRGPAGDTASVTAARTAPYGRSRPAKHSSND
jgi:hypothetical protein